MNVNSKIEVRPEVKAIVIDINENNNPEFELSVDGSFLIEFDAMGVKTSGELKAKVRWDLIPQF